MYMSLRLLSREAWKVVPGAELIKGFLDLSGMPGAGLILDALGWGYPFLPLVVGVTSRY